MNDGMTMFEHHPQDSRVRTIEDGLCPTITTKTCSGGTSMPILMDNTTYVVRRITPKECERLQGFPDDYTNIPWKDGKPCPDSHRYKALGNSMAVPVMRWIGSRIVEVLDNPITEDTSEPMYWQPELF